MYGTFNIICDEFQKCKTLFKIFLIFQNATNILCFSSFFDIVWYKFA